VKKLKNENFIKYPEMKTLFKLIPSGTKGKKWDATNGEILPETAALHYIPMEELVFTEKIDGTNMGIRVTDGAVTHIQKREHICERENKGDAFYFEIGDMITKLIEDKNIEVLKSVIIYGELCGEKIQNGGKYFASRKFIVFDIYDTETNRFFTWDHLYLVRNLYSILSLEQREWSSDMLRIHCRIGDGWLK